MNFHANRDDTRKIFIAVCRAIRDTLVAGEDVYLNYIGKFYHFLAQERAFFNFGKGQTILPEHDTVRFKSTGPFKRLFLDPIKEPVDEDGD